MFVSVPWYFERPANNGMVLYGLDCEIECEVRNYGGEPEVSSITAIYVYGDGKVADLLNSDSGATDMGELIRKRVIGDRDFAAKAVDAAGYSFTGRNANDPSGRWVRGAA